MKLTSTLILALTALLPAQTVLFSDSFNTPDAGGFNSAPLDGRLSGTLASETYLRQTKQVQGIMNNQLITTGTGGLRFENAANDPDITGNMDHFDWAAGTAGTTILAANGFVVTFDWTPENDTDREWVSWNVGHPNADANFRITGGLTDYGILLRNDGDCERWDNASNLGAGGTFTTTEGGATTYAVSIAFSFNSFADGSNVTAVTSVDGTQIASDTFQWDGNAGSMHMEFFTNKTGNLIDNLTIATPTESIYTFTLTGNTFRSSDAQGTPIGTLAGLLDGNAEPSTFELVAGDGDEDNAKFQITGSEIQIGNFDFTGAGSAHEQTFNVRVRSTNNGATRTEEKALTVTVIEDDDADMLVDPWELLWAGNLTDLSGVLGTEDFDNDLLPDLDEFLMSTGSLAGVPAYPGINPTNPDTDSDTLKDGEEINPAAPRVQTNPTAADTDRDGLSDLAETNSSTFVDLTNTGTNPIECDTDSDGARDLWEIENGGNPFDGSDFATTVSNLVEIIPISDLASSGLDGSKEYTHAVSGGTAVTVNGVNFDLLDLETTPANFTWDTGAFAGGRILTNNNTWDPALGGVTDFDLQTLFGGFVFSTNGTRAGNKQTYTLSGLTPGTTYDLRIYCRPWDTGGSGRPIDYTFINGTEEITPFGSLLTDRPGKVTGSGNQDESFIVSFVYSAQETELVIEAAVPDCANGVSGSHHLYALTNEVGGSLGPPVVTRTSKLSSGAFLIGFTGRPNTTYIVTSSPDLETAFNPLPDPEVTTDPEGEGLIIVPALEASDPKLFFRIELP